MTPWLGDCVVHDCQQPGEHLFRRLDVPWLACENHTADVAQLLGIANPAKENR